MAHLVSAKQRRPLLNFYFYGEQFVFTVTETMSCDRSNVVFDNIINVQNRSLYAS